MKKFNNKTLLSCMLALGITSISHAQTSEPLNIIEEASLDIETNVTKQIKTNALVTKKIIDDSIANIHKRDELRNIEELHNMEKGTISAEIEKLKAKKELINIKFLVDNVPAEVMAAGDKEIAAYVVSNFIDTKTTVEEKETIHSLWKSSDNTLTVAKPIRMPIPTIIMDGNSQPSTQAKVSNDLLPTGNVTYIDEDALSALKVSKEDLDAMFDGDVKTKNTDDENSSPIKDAYVEANVIITDIIIDRAVIMGKNSFINASLTMNVISNNGTASVKKEFAKISPGYMFKVNNTTFELLSMDESSVVFENLNTNVTYRELIE